MIRVEAELGGGGQYMPNLNVSYTLEEKSNIVRDVSSPKLLSFLSHTEVVEVSRASNLSHSKLATN